MCSSFATGKFAMRALAQSLAREFGPKGVHVVHAIIDGVIDIERTKEWKFEHEDAKIKPDSVSIRSFASLRSADGVIRLPTRIGTCTRSTDRVSRTRSISDRTLRNGKGPRHILIEKVVYPISRSPDRFRTSRYLWDASWTSSMFPYTL